MKEFHVGDKVVTVKNGELLNGVVKNSFPLDPPVIVIEYEDGTVEKILSKDIAPAPELPTTQNEERVNPEITITQEDFERISLKVLTDLVIAKKIHAAVGISFTAILADITKALFIDEIEN